ncbi:phosphatase [Lithospermum erythrorhizon]|uniref:Phosphatase n=1 Tax=Lithospermum erythrorhizon TaxID=34254 RepID=A0AAV3Q8X4_LITER
METVGCLVNTLHFTSSFCNKSKKINSITHLHSSSFVPLNFKKVNSCIKKVQLTNASVSSNNFDQNQSDELAILLEVEGVLMDVYRLCNRRAFNVAFGKLGLDCANWTEPIYMDLVRKSTGDEERMLILYFNRIGWPTSVPTKEQTGFIKRVLREKKSALDDLVLSETLPLRPGVADFIDDACKEGVPVVILTAYSRSGEKVVRSIAERVVEESMSKIKIVGDDEVKKSFYGQLVYGKGVSSSLDELIAKEVTKAASSERQRIAKEVASMLKLSVDLDTSSSERIQLIVAALRAGAEYADVPAMNCVLVAGSQSGVTAAERIGMPCFVLRSSLTARAEFPSAKATLDGFGDADLTISKILKKRWA